MDQDNSTTEAIPVQEKKLTESQDRQKAAGKERRKAYYRAYYKKNRENRLAQVAAYYQAHPEKRAKANARSAEWHKAHPERTAKAVKKSTARRLAKMTPEELESYKKLKADNFDWWHKNRTDEQKAKDRERHRVSHLKETPEEKLARNLKSDFGITTDFFYEMLKRQDGRCGICGTKNPAPHKRFSVDHCHQTGAIRGLLCCRCNRAMGMFQDRPQFLEKAVAWLKTVTSEEALDWSI
jgi:hypothetical protein